MGKSGDRPADTFLRKEEVVIFKTLRACKWVAVKVAHFLGFVPISEMTSAVEKLSREMINAVETLKHKTRNLENQIELRKLLEGEVDFLRRQALLHASHGSDVQVAVGKLETIAGNLTELMQSVWPQAYLDDAFEPSKSTAEIQIS